MQAGHVAERLTVGSDRMRIAQVCPRYPPSRGGIESHVENLSRRLAAAGFRVEVLTTDAGTAARVEVRDGVTVRRFKSWAPNGSYHFSPRLWRYLKEHGGEYDIFHAHSYRASPNLCPSIRNCRQALPVGSNWVPGAFDFPWARITCKR